jgi:hypothetical protein
VRVVGAAAIASAASVVIDNTVVGWAGSPTYAAPIKEVLAFHAENRAAVEIAVGLEALTLPLLLLFVTGLHGLVGRRGGAGAAIEPPPPTSRTRRRATTQPVLWSHFWSQSTSVQDEPGTQSNPAERPRIGHYDWAGR